MRLSSFMSVSVDGYFADNAGEIGWAHSSKPDPEYADFVAGNARGGGRLLFGRVTYDMMASYWPTPQAQKAQPVVAHRMNEGAKIVVSRSLERATWNNTVLLKGDLIAEVQTLKAGADHVTILGSGSIVSQLAHAGLIDEYQLVIIPVVLGDGRRLFEPPEMRMPLRLAESRAFNNGNVFLRYGITP